MTGMTDSLQQLIESMKDEAARLEAELRRETGEIASAALRGELVALRRVSVQIGGIVRAEAGSWQQLLKEIS